MSSANGTDCGEENIIEEAWQYNDETSKTRRFLFFSNIALTSAQMPGPGAAEREVKARGRAGGIKQKMSGFSVGFRGATTPEPFRTDGGAAFSAPGNNWNREPAVLEEKSYVSEDDHVTSILVHDLNSAIPQSDLEQGLHGLFSVFGHISSVTTVSHG
jgi:hypothetical protein